MKYVEVHYSVRSEKTPTRKHLLKQSMLLTSVIVIVSVLAGAVPAYGQSEGRSVTTLEEVVVTAHRREESLQAIPVAVTALSEGFLRTQSVAQVQDLGTKVPSLRISMAGFSVPR